MIEPIDEEIRRRLVDAASKGMRPRRFTESTVWAPRSPRRVRFVLAAGDAGWHQCVYDCIKAFPKTDQTDDLRKMTVPTLFTHGDDDQVVPVAAASQAAVKIAPKGQRKVYPGAPHGLATTQKDQVTADLLAFLKA